MVKINFAMGASSVTAVRAILSVGILGGLASGCLAALIVTGLAMWPAAAESILAPFVSGGTACDLLPTAAEVAQQSRSYLILSSWCWPLIFVNMSMRGFLLGSGEVASYFVSGLLLLAVQAVGLMCFFAKDPSLEILALIGLAQTVVNTLSIIVAIFSNRQLREKYSLLHWKLSEEAAVRVQPLAGGMEGMEVESSAEASERSSTRNQRLSLPAFRESMSTARNVRSEAVYEGLCAMVVDVSFQLGLTVGTYTAGASMGIGPLYQIGALQAALPQFGLSWIVGLTYSLRIVGSRLVGQKAYERFQALLRFAVVYVAVLAVAASASTLPFTQPITLNLAEQSCEFAWKHECLPVYTSVFGGEVDNKAPLQSSFILFGPIMLGVAGYTVLKAGMYCVFDFQFMAVAGASVFVCVFIPAIIVARFWINQPWAIITAMYLPAWVLVFVFALRMQNNLKRMLAREAGPWNGNQLPGSTIVQPAD